jgi:hypothetical protein
MTVYIIKYTDFRGRKVCVYNKRGNALEFFDKEHAEYFMQQHPEATFEHPYEITARNYTADNEECMEYGNTKNIWEGEDAES